MPADIHEPADPDPLLRDPFDVTPHTAPAEAPRSSAPSRRSRFAWLGAGIALVGLVALGWLVMGGGYRLDIRTVPAGAAISVDGAVTGRRTPAVVSLSSRPERIGLTLDGYEPIDAAVADTADARMSLTYRLRRLLQVHSQPAGARIVIDGRDTGLVTPAAVPLDEPHPSAVELQLAGHQPGREPLTPAMIESGTLTMKLSPVRAANRPAEESTALVAVTLSGSYRFEVTGCGRTSPASDVHELEVAAPCTLRLRAPDYFLDLTRTVTPVAGGLVELTAPPLLNVQLRSRHEDCMVLIGGRDVGSPPVDLAIAAGSYSATLKCPDGRTLQTGTFELEAGTSIRRIDDYLR